MRPTTLVVSATLAILAFSGPPAKAETNACTGKRGVSGTFYKTITSSGLTRTFRLDVPAGNNANVAAPVIFNFHGLGGNGDNQAVGTDMPAVGGAAGFITIHADGVDNSWNAGSCCGTAALQKIDDVQFVRDMLAEVSASYCLDAGRVHSTGFSNGGYFSHRLACEASDIIASVAPVSGLVGVDCNPERPVPVHQSHGTADPLVFYNRAVEDLADWAAINGCTTGPDSYYSRGNITCTRYDGCDEGAVVELCTARFVGHTWVDSRFYDTTEENVDFFLDHPMQ